MSKYCNDFVSDIDMNIKKCDFSFKIKSRNIHSTYSIILHDS